MPRATNANTKNVRVLDIYDFSDLVSRSLKPSFG
jgi:hypothetical protein